MEGPPSLSIGFSALFYSLDLKYKRLIKVLKVVFLPVLSVNKIQLKVHITFYDFFRTEKVKWHFRSLYFRLFYFMSYSVVLISCILQSVMYDRKIMSNVFSSFYFWVNCLHCLWVWVSWQAEFSFHKFLMITNEIPYTINSAIEDCF